MRHSQVTYPEEAELAPPLPGAAGGGGWMYNRRRPGSQNGIVGSYVWFLSQECDCG